MIEWECFGPALCHWLAEGVPLDTIQQVNEAEALFDTVAAPALEVSSQIQPGFTSGYKRISDEVTLLARERNRLQRHLQRTCGMAVKAAFNRTPGDLRHDMQSFCRCCWELAEMNDPAEE